jgi:hypothetical protein
MSHNSHEELLICLLFSTLWKNLNTISNFTDEIFDVFNLSNSIAQKEASVAVDPFIDCVLKFLDKWSSIDSQPSNVNRLLELIDVISGSV